MVSALSMTKASMTKAPMTKAPSMTNALGEADDENNDLNRFQTHGHSLFGILVGLVDGWSCLVLYD